MTTVLLVRHASHDLLGRILAGRAPAVLLNSEGRHEAAELATRLARLPIAAVYTSPRERAHETAAPLCEQLGLTAHSTEAFDEIDFGTWTGQAFTELESEEEWRVWIDERTRAVVPGGETIGAVQQRIFAELIRVAASHPGETIVVVSHGDVIKAALAKFLGLSLDNLERFDVAPASVSVVVIGDGWSQVRSINAFASPIHH
ncbi:MAG TPA: histidine phosphatase family protein [Chthoniobacteraceae bacterium]|nr:histidine phosphatase family protein [Chthoniobacteraceae bacterium]